MFLKSLRVGTRSEVQYQLALSCVAAARPCAYIAKACAYLAGLGGASFATETYACTLLTWVPWHRATLFGTIWHYFVKKIGIVD